MEIQNNINIRRVENQNIYKANKAVDNTPVQNTEDNSEKVMAGLNSLASINKVAINTPQPKKEEFSLNLSTEELTKRTDPDVLVTTTMLKPGA